MRLSYSRINTFKQCPYQYKLRYIDGLKTKFNLDPSNALILGTALHLGIEKNTKEAIKYYYSNYPSATPAMINEAIKLEIMIRKAKEVLPNNGKYELKIDDEDFVGFIDMLSPGDKDTHYNLYDFKYSNNVDNYLKSGQLHLYKYYFEKHNLSNHIRDTAFVFVPKVNLKRDKHEELDDYRKRIIKECEAQEVKIVSIEYDQNKVIEFLTDAKHCIECKDFNKNVSKLCYWCEFKNYCQSNQVNDANIIYPADQKGGKENG